MGKAGKMGNFRRSRGEKPKEDNSLPSQRPTESLFWRAGYRGTGGGSGRKLKGRVRNQ